MPRRPISPGYVPQSAVDPYYGDYSALAQQYLRGRNKPIYSTGQGIAEVLGDLGEAYFERKARERGQKRQEEDLSNLAMAQQLAMRPNLVTTPEGQVQPPAGAPYFETSGFPQSTGPERAQAAVSAMNPRNAVQYGPSIADMAAQLAPRQFSGTLKKDERAFVDGRQVAAGVEDMPDILKPGVLDAEIKKSQATRQPNNVQTVQTADGLFILNPNGTLGNKLGDLPAREKAPKMQTYYGEDGRTIQLDSNDPEDQKVIKERGLVTDSPSDSQRMAKGFLDRMTAAEKEIEQIIKNDPSILTSVKDNAVAGFGMIGNMLVSDKYRQAMQKVKDWTRAKLRKESGAVIGDQEAKDEFATYFGTAGDDPATLEGKKTSRLEARRQLATAAGILGRGALKDLDVPAASPTATSGTDTPPEGVDQRLWNVMTPQEKALWSSKKKK